MTSINAATRSAIEALIAEYSWLLDHAGWSELSDLCTPDLRMTMGGNVIEGVDGLAAWAVQRAQRPERRTHHQTTNVRLVPGGNEQEVSGTVMLVLHVSNAGSDPAVEFVGEYQDRYVRIGDDWRFASRDVVPITRP